MTIRPGHATRKTPSGGTTKSSTKGLDVVKMNDFEQRQFTGKNRAYSPFSPMGSPTTPLNFEQLFQAGQLPVGGDFSPHDQAMLQAHLLNNMRNSAMANKAQQSQQQQSQSLAMLDQIRQAYDRGELEDSDWNARAFAAAAVQQQEQEQPQHLQRDDPPHEPSTIALLQQKFAQLERHKAEMHKSSRAQQVQLYPSQWPPMSTQQPSSLVQSPAPAPTFAEPRHYASTNGGFYPLQQQQHQQVFTLGLTDGPEQHFSGKQEVNWRPTQANLPILTPSNRSNLAPAGWALASSPQNSDNLGGNAFMYFNQPPSQPQHQQQQQQKNHRQQQKLGDYQQNMGVVPNFAGSPQQAFSSLPANVPMMPDMGLLGSIVVPSRCDNNTGGHSMDVKNVSELQYSSDESEMSLDNFSCRMPSHVSQSAASNLSNAAQVPFGNNFQLLPQSTKSAFSTFTRNAGPQRSSAVDVGVTTKSLLFNDTYRLMHEQLESHDDVDTTLHL